MEHLPAPKEDFTPSPECYQKCLDWVEECELLLNGPLASKSKSVKANYVLIWTGKAGGTHIVNESRPVAEYIDRVTILCDQCEYPPEARDRLLRDAIVIGIRSKEAYYKCIEQG